MEGWNKFHNETHQSLCWITSQTIASSWWWCKVALSQFRGEPFGWSADSLRVGSMGTRVQEGVDETSLWHKSFQLFEFACVSISMLILFINGERSLLPDSLCILAFLFFLYMHICVLPFYCLCSHAAPITLALESHHMSHLSFFFSCNIFQEQFWSTAKFPLMSSSSFLFLWIIWVNLPFFLSFPHLSSLFLKNSY